jgi:hypothetical protein
MIPAARPLIGQEDRAAVEAVLTSGGLAQGPEVAAFQQEFSHLAAGRACVGLGMMRCHHDRVLAGLEGVELVGIADPVVGVRKAPTGVPVLPDPEALLALGIDYAVVSGPTATYLKRPLSLAEARMDTLIEEPVATEFSAARIIAAAFGAAWMVSAVAPIEHADLGEVHQVSTREPASSCRRDQRPRGHSRHGDPRRRPHRTVVQQPYASVSARTAHRSGRPHEDLVAITAVLRDGSVANHLVNWLSPAKERVTTITGERCCFVADTLTADLTFFENGVVPTEGALARFRGVSEGDVTRYAFPKPEPLRTEHEHFRDAALGKGCDIVTLRQASDTVAVANAAAEAAAQGVCVLMEDGV